MEHITHSAAETRQLAQRFAETLHGGEVLCLYGDLGRGKTTFVQGLGKGLGITRNVNSPTFLIMRSYKLSTLDEEVMGNSLGKTLYHVDLYRLEHEQEMIDIGLFDLMHDPDAIVVIEWPEKLGALVLNERIDIHFDYIDEDSKSITIKEVHGKSY